MHEAKRGMRHGIIMAQLWEKGEENLMRKLSVYVAGIFMSLFFFRAAVCCVVHVCVCVSLCVRVYYAKISCSLIRFIAGRILFPVFVIFFLLLKVNEDAHIIVRLMYI